VISVVRGIVGPPAAGYPYPEPAGAVGGPVKVGVVTGDTVAVRLNSTVAGPLQARVITGPDRTGVMAAQHDAPAVGCEVQAGSLLYLHGLAATAPGQDARIEVTQGAETMHIDPLVRDGMDLHLRVWKFSVSAVDPDNLDLAAHHGPYQPIQVCGQDLDAARVVADVAASWRPAGIIVTAPDIRDGHLEVSWDQDLRTSVSAALKQHAVFMAALRDTAQDRVINMVLVDVYDRFGLTWASWARDDNQADGPAVRKDLQGFPGPFVLAAAGGPLDQNWSWYSRSLDYRSFAPLQGPLPNDLTDMRNFQYLGFSSDVAHELGHALGLAHPPETDADQVQDAYLHSLLMHPRVVCTADRWNQPGWPVTLLGQTASTRVVTELKAPVGPTRLRPVAQNTTSLATSDVSLTVQTGQSLLLTCRRQSQWVTLAQDLTSGGGKTVNVTSFLPARSYPAGLGRLLQLGLADAFIRGALIPATRVDQARDHITSGRAFAN
jgi:hypothetical protein